MASKRKIFLIPLALAATTLVTACVPDGSGINEGGGINTVTVTFNATNSGYYPNSKQPDSRDEVIIKEVRYGITWGKLVADHEKPTDPTCNKIGYQFAGYKLGSAMIQDDYKITSDISLNAVYSTVGHRFCYDPWETVIEEANKGLSNLTEYYGIDPDYKANGSSFIGLERDLQYSDTNYKVRVIGQNADDLATGTNKVAALTFEFVQLLPGFAYDADDTSVYETSTLRNALNGRVMNNIDETLRLNLQKVKKYTNEGGGTYGKEHIKTTQDYVFVPSMYELGILNDENGNLTEREGYIYDYYRTHNTNDDRKKSYRNRFGDLVEATYWTRSPDTTVDKAVWPINNSGRTGVESAGAFNTIDPAIALGISPCFAIGVSNLDPDERPIFANDSWAKIVETANKGYKALKERYKIDMANNNDTFLGLTHELEVQSKNMTVKYQVKVIGENHDTYSETKLGFTTNYTTPLTFQFTSVVGQQEDMYISKNVNTEGMPAWFFDLDQGDNFNYYDTQVCRCLDNSVLSDYSSYRNTKMDEKWSEKSDGKTLLEMIVDKDLANGIRSVKKKGWERLLLEYSDITTYSYKLFPLSYNEYGAYQQNVDTYGTNFTQLITDDKEKPYEYYDYRLVTDKNTKAEKYKEIERRRIFNDVTEAYTTKTVSGVTCKVPVLDKNKDGNTKWAHSYLRTTNLNHLEWEGFFLFVDLVQNYSTLHPNGEANDWAGMPIAESYNAYIGGDSYYSEAHPDYRIGVVPAFAIGRDKVD